MEKSRARKLKSKKWKVNGKKKFFLIKQSLYEKNENKSFKWSDSKIQCYRIMQERTKL